MKPAPQCSGPPGRREFLRLGLAGLSALSLPELMRLRADGAARSKRQSPARKTSLIVVWLPGGASHLETYDPKPLAGSAFRGPYAPRATNVPGMQISELLPRHAEVADRFSLLRSMVHTGFCHQQGTHQLFTGHPVRVLKQKPDNPDCLAIANRLRYDPRRPLPNYIGCPPINYLGAAYLGPSYEPFAVRGDPNQPKFTVPNVGLTKPETAARVSRRIALRKRLDRWARVVDRHAEMNAYDDFEKQAWNLLTSSRARDAFDLSKESAKTRDRYGRNRWGQQCLLARRLVEAGVELVTTQFAGDLCGRVGNWDDHAVNHNVFEGMKHRCPYYDQAVAALIEDLYDRGLDRDLMLVVTGEFGRTPRINYQPSTGKGVASAAKGVKQPGRDHWPRATSMLFAGGGIPTGQVIGATDIRGEDAVERIVGRGDFLATIYRHLGIDAEQIAFPNFAGRPIPIPSSGKAITELTAASS